MSRATIVLAVSAAAGAAGVYSLLVARNHPVYSFTGASGLRDLALLGAGWALTGCGLAYWAKTARGLFGPLLIIAGFAWFFAEWNNPAQRSALAFTFGRVFYGLVCAALVGHAVLAYARGPHASLVERAAVLIAYAGSFVVLGFLPALFFDSRAQGCSQCPRDLLFVTNRPGAVQDLNQVGVYLGLTWALGLAALAGMKLPRASGAMRLVLVPGLLYLGLVAAEFAAALDRGFVTNQALETRLWLGEAVALVGIALGASWSWIRARRARSAVARLVVDLAQAPPPGGLRDVLASIVGDPELVLAYPLSDSGGLVDAEGRPVEVSRRAEQTTLVHEGGTVAVLAHAPGLLDDEQLVDEVAAAARLALEYERLQAEVRVRIQELRSSRARIVATGDAERKRLERDLHDGAQQRLVALALSLRLLRSQLSRDCDPRVVLQLDEAEAGLDRAISQLRELAHGIFPAVLADGGLAAAVRALTEEGPVPIRIRHLPEGRFAPAVETAVYTVVAEAARTATRGLVIHGDQHDGMLVVEIETQDEGGTLDHVALEDRLGALDGWLSLHRGEGGRLTIRTEVPCGS